MNSKDHSHPGLRVLLGNKEVKLDLTGLSDLENRLGVKFLRTELLHLALVHSSFVHENPEASPTSNERLEFLGDAVLGAVTSIELYERFPDWSEGDLTNARASLVRGEALASIGKKLDLGTYLYVGRGEGMNGGRERPANLAAVFESIVGAMFLDQGYFVVRDFIIRVMSECISNLSSIGVPINPKSLLQEMLQNRGISAPKYEIVESVGEAHSPEFTVEAIVDGRRVGKGTGSRKIQAENAAAAEAIKLLS